MNEKTYVELEAASVILLQDKVGKIEGWWMSSTDSVSGVEAKRKKGGEE